jgi:hypothetical protein
VSELRLNLNGTDRPRLCCTRYNGMQVDRCGMPAGCFGRSLRTLSWATDASARSLVVLSAASRKDANAASSKPIHNERPKKHHRARPSMPAVGRNA